MAWVKIISGIHRNLSGVMHRTELNCETVQHETRGYFSWSALCLNISNVYTVRGHASQLYLSWSTFGSWLGKNFYLLISPSWTLNGFKDMYISTQIIMHMKLHFNKFTPLNLGLKLTSSQSNECWLTCTWTLVARIVPLWDKDVKFVQVRKS